MQLPKSTLEKLALAGLGVTALTVLSSRAVEARDPVDPVTAQEKSSKPVATPKPSPAPAPAPTPGKDPCPPCGLG